MCRIFGCSLIAKLTEDQARIATNKIKILGLLSFPNLGRDACGIYINGQIFHGKKEGSIDTTEFDDFLTNPDFILPSLDPKWGNVIIGHVRQASVGTAKIASNTHPFLIKGATEKDDIVFLHNGTIDNPWQLCEKHGIDHVGEHINLDSKALGTLLVRVGNSVLTEYKGAAALLWTKPSDPTTMYAFHGASYRFKSDKTLSEERPLWHMATKEGIYFASEAKFLQAIKESEEDEIAEFVFNKVVQFTNGKVVGKGEIIEREDTNIFVSTPPPTRFIQQGKWNHSDSEIPFNRNIVTDIRSNSLIKGRRAEKGGKGSSPKIPRTNIIWEELRPKESLAHSGKNYVSFYQGRYHLPNGTLATNLLWIKDRGIVVEQDTPGAIPYWFWKGVLLKGKEAYEALVKEANASNSWVNSVRENYAACISRHTKFPVCNMETECIDESDFFRFSWYLGERRVINNTFTPDFSGRSYKIIKGFLVEITSSHTDDKVFAEEDNPKLSVFDIVFQDQEEIHQTLSNDEFKAIEEFLEDKLTQEWNQAPLVVETQQQMWQLLRTGIAANISIRQVLGDKDHLLETYLEDTKSSKYAVETINFIESIESSDKLSEAYLSLKAPIIDAETNLGAPWPEDDESLHDATAEDYEEVMNQQEIDEQIRDFEQGRERQKELEEFNSSSNKVGEAIDIIQELSTVSDELSSMILSDYATEAAEAIKKGVDSMKKDLEEVSEKNNDGESVMKINQIVAS